MTLSGVEKTLTCIYYICTTFTYITHKRFFQSDILTCRIHTNIKTKNMRSKMTHLIAKKCHDFLARFVPFLHLLMPLTAFFPWLTKHK